MAAQSVVRAAAARRCGGYRPEHRARQAEAIQRWKPWEHSTGPKTAAGKAKAKASHNGYKGGVRAAQQEMARLLRECAERLKMFD